MFLDSELIRPLFDTIHGGPPVAFECQLCRRVRGYPGNLSGFVCRTLRGMRLHQTSIHGVTIQGKLPLDMSERNLASTEPVRENGVSTGKEKTP